MPFLRSRPNIYLLFFCNIITHSIDITMETSDDSFSTSFLQDVLQLNGTSISNVCDQASESLNFSAFEVADVTERLGHYHKLRQLVEAIEEKEASVSADISSFTKQRQPKQIEHINNNLAVLLLFFR